jgi:Glycosyl hydrolase family 9/Cellulase N-terminal ig-like domain
MRITILSCVLVILFAHLYAQNRLVWDGEAATDSCQTEWGHKTDSIQHSGTYSFMGNPDHWHAPGIRLHCTPSWRVNISHYDELRFWIKMTANGVGKTVKLSIYGWPNVSRGVEITPYIIGGGGVDTNWKEVRLPIDSLKKPTFQVGVSEIIYISASPGTPVVPIYNYFVDDVWAVDTKPTRVKEIKMISNQVLRLDIADGYDTTAVKTLTNYSIESSDDTDFATPQNPTSLGMHYYVEDYDPSDNYNNPIPIINYQLFPIFTSKMKNGKTYTLTVQNVRDKAGNDFVQPYTKTFIFNDLSEVTGSVKANHVGYLPNRPKYGYIGNFCGAMENDIVVMPIEQTPTFEIRDQATNLVVYTGAATLRTSLSTYNCNAVFNVPDPTVDKRWAGEKVYSCDFTNFNQAGTYYLYVSGYGRSYPFRIGADTYDEAYRTVIRSLYLNRCGTELTPQHAGQWARPTCHTTDGMVHSSQTVSPLYDNEVVNSTIACTKGWHDAGDYGKYVASAAQPVNELLSAFEMYPQKFPDGFNNIPESGNGIPDVLDEVKWELDWLLTMQAPDGGVFFKVVTTNWPNWMPQNDNATRWITEKTTHATGMACAMYAAAARIYRPYLPVFADSCLAKARRSWAWLEAHPNTFPTNGFHNPTGIGGGEFGDPGATSDVDERAWAAAELYKTTGESDIHTRFLYFWLQNNANYGWNEFQHNQSRATWAYCTTTFPTNQTYITNYKNSVKTGIEQYQIPRLNQTTYRCSHRPEVLLWIAWGSYGVSMQYAWSQIRASYLLGRDYYNSAAINLDVQLGNNPQNRSYITGVGYDYPMDPLHHPSNTDGIIEPLPGLCVFGPHSSLGGVGYYAASQRSSNLYPTGNWECAPYPSLRRYYDVFENVCMNEPTRSMEATTAVVLAYFSSQNAVSTPLPLELIDFKGIMNKELQAIQLVWATAQETNIQGFDIEYDFGKGDFKKIGCMAAHQSTALSNYSFHFKDYNRGVNRFRLKILEKDGSFTYSKIIEIMVETNHPTMIYKSNTLIINDLQNDSASNITIFNSLGQLILNQKIPANTNWFELPLPTLAIGIYNAVLQQGGYYTYLKF